MKNEYLIKECESCKIKNKEVKLHKEYENDISYFICDHCSHKSFFINSKFIYKNVISKFMVEKLSEVILNDIIENKNEKPYVLRENETCEIFNVLKGRPKKYILSLIFKYILNGDLEIEDKMLQESIKRIKIPLIPNYKDGYVSGLGVLEVSFEKWFESLSLNKVNPLTGESSVLNKNFYDEITVLKNGVEYISWNCFWIYIKRNMGLRDIRDVLDSRNNNYRKAKDYYYHFAAENKMNIEFEEVIKKKPENLSNLEKKYFAYFKMDKSSDDFLMEKPIIKDFWLKCLDKPFKKNMEWDELYFNLDQWAECYWGHITILDKLTKRHPARKNGRIYFI